MPAGVLKRTTQAHSRGRARGLQVLCSGAACCLRPRRGVMTVTGGSRIVLRWSELPRVPVFRPDATRGLYDNEEQRHPLLLLHCGGGAHPSVVRAAGLLFVPQLEFARTQCPRRPGPARPLAGALLDGGETHVEHRDDNSRRHVGSRGRGDVQDRPPRRHVRALGPRQRPAWRRRDSRGHSRLPVSSPSRAPRFVHGSARPERGDADDPLLPSPAGTTAQSPALSTRGATRREVTCQTRATPRTTPTSCPSRPRPPLPRSPTTA